MPERLRKIPSGLREAHRPARWYSRFTDKPFKTAWLVLSIVTLGLTIIGGTLIRLLDPENIHSIGDGLWWSIQTVTTVGYGDIVPGTTLGRLVGVVMMVTGIAFLTVTTAAVTNLFIEAARERRLHDAADSDDMARLHERLDELLEEVRALREERDADT